MHSTFTRVQATPVQWFANIILRILEMHSCLGPGTMAMIGWKPTQKLGKINNMKGASQEGSRSEGWFPWPTPDGGKKRVVARYPHNYARTR